MGWKTFTVPSFGGEPRLLLSNATGLTWLDERRLLFSEVRTGLHMGIVSATETRSDHRTIYFPHNERAMAHFSYASPDRKWALVIEMDPAWQPCRLIALDGDAESRHVGPNGSCTSAGWSPDGEWMYFSANVAGSHHLWRQRFPDGAPEQLTFGPTDHKDEQTGPYGTPTGGANWEQMRKTFWTQGTVLSTRNQWIVSPTLVNEFTFGYSQRPEGERIPEEELKRNQRDTIGFTAPQLYPSANPLNLIRNATFGGVSQPINLNMDGRTPLDQRQYAYNVTNNIAKNFAAHLLKAGVFYNHNLRQAQLPAAFNSTINYGRNANNPLDTGYAFSNAMFGVFNTHQQATSRPDISETLNATWLFGWR